MFEAEATAYPPYFYELALTHMLRDDWVSAATALRRGFVANPYIAELLGGNASPAPLAIWHGTNFAEPQVASDYIRMYGMYWHNQSDSFAFTRWLFNHSKILAERAAIMECKEALLWETDITLRGRILEQASRLTAAIDDRLSESIVTKRQNRHGQMVWPWLVV